MGTLMNLSPFLIRLQIRVLTIIYQRLAFFHNGYTQFKGQIIYVYIISNFLERIVLISIYLSIKIIYIVPFFLNVTDLFYLSFFKFST